MSMLDSFTIIRDEYCLESLSKVVIEKNSVC